MSLARQTRWDRLAVIAVVTAVFPLHHRPVSAQKPAGPPQAVQVSIEGPLTIDEAIAIGLAHQPVLSIAQENLKAARGATRQSRSQLLPSLSLRSGFSRSMSTGSAVVEGVEVEGGARRFSTQYNTSLGFDQLLFDFGRSADQYRRSRMQRRATAHELEQTEDDVINSVQQAFLVLLTNQELLQVAQDELRFQEGTVELTQAEFGAGRVARADVARAESARASAQLQVTSVENAVALSRVALNEAMGIDVRTGYEIAPLPEGQPVAMTLDELMGVAIRQRPDGLAAQAQVAAAEASLRVAQKGHRPSVSGGASLGWRDSDFPPGREYWGVDVGLNMNIFDGWFTEGQEQQARANRNAARDAAYDVMERVATETAQSFLDLRTAEQQIVSAQAAVDSGDEALRLADGRYRAGVGILLEVLDAQAALTFARADLARARFFSASARYELERAIGVSLAELAQGGDEEEE